PSSPKTSTRSSSDIASRSAALRARDIVTGSAIQHLAPLPGELCRRLGVGPIEHPLGGRARRLHERRPHGRDRCLGLLLTAVEESAIGEAGAEQPRAIADEWVRRAPSMHLFLVAVAAAVVGRRMRSQAIRE